MLRKLKQQWYQRLKDEGFIDIEMPDGSLKTYDRRTVAFDFRQQIMEFFLDLDQYIAQTQLKLFDKQVLILYSGGMHVKEIAYCLGVTRQWISRIIRIHKIEMGYKFKPGKHSPCNKPFILRKREFKD
jgi:hypothetical protein